MKRCNCCKNQTAEYTRGLDERKLKGVIGKVVVLLMLTGVLMVLASCSKTEIDLADYIQEPMSTGLNGRGVLSYSLDKAAIYELLVAEVDYAEVGKDYDEEDAAKAWEIYDMADKAMNSLSITASKEADLSNGDVVTITASFADPEIKKFPYHFKDATIEYTVSGLPEGRTFDPFGENIISLVFDGFSGSGTAEVEKLVEEGVYECLRYELSEQYDLMNGDTVSVTVSYDPEDLEALGYFEPKATEKAYVVEGLTEYISSAAEVSVEAKEKMEQLLLTDMQTRLNGDLDEYDSVIQEPIILGAYFVSTGDMSVIYKDPFRGIEAQNAVILLGWYCFEESGMITFTDDTLVIYVFQNCYLDTDENLVCEEPLDYYLDYTDTGSATIFARNLFSEYELVPLN